MIKAVIFDINKVLLESANLSDRFESDFGIQAERFLPVLKTFLAISYLPNASPAFNYWKPYLDNWKVSLTEQEFWNYWFNAEKLVEPIVEKIRTLKTKGIKIFTLSNNFRERAESYEKSDWMQELVDKAYFSFRTGILKPNPYAWEILLKENSLLPEECLYFDDQEKHVLAAKNLGVHSYLFESTSKTLDTIEQEVKLS